MRLMERFTLAEDDTVFAIGYVYPKLGYLLNRKIQLLIRSGSGTYFLMDRDGTNEIEIRGVLQTTVEHHFGKTPVKLIGLASISDMIYFSPLDLRPAKINKIYIFPKVSAAFMLNTIKELNELILLNQCPICSTTQPADELQCSNPGCQAKLKSIEETSAGARITKVSLIVGGFGGALAGLLIFVIALAFAWIGDAPPELMAWIREYWWIFPLVPGALGYLGFLLVLNKTSPQG